MRARWITWSMLACAALTSGCAVPLRQAGPPATPPLDDSAALQQQLDAAAARGGGVVQLRAGTYRLRRVLRIPSRVTLRGEGSAATTLLLVELGTTLPDNPPGCEPGTPPPQRLSGALFNAGHNHLQLQRRFVPQSGTCIEPRVLHPQPPDHDIALSGLTLDCNSRALYPGGPQAAGNNNVGCANFDNLRGLTLTDVTIRDANVDGMLLGLYDGVVDFTLRDLRIEGSGRFGIGWIAATHGVFERVELDGNLAGGIDLEPIARFGPEGVAAHVTLREVHVRGTAASPERLALGRRFGRDDGITLCFSKNGLTRDLRLERVLIEDVTGVGVRLVWGGDYQDVDFDLDIRRTGVGGLYSALPGRGTATVRGRMEDVGAEASGSAVGLFDHERGWTIGPLRVRQGPRWGNGSAISFSNEGRDHLLRDVEITVTCDPRDSGCQRSIVAAPRRGPLDPSIRLLRSAVRHAPVAAPLPGEEKRD